MYKGITLPMRTSTCIKAAVNGANVRRGGEHLGRSGSFYRQRGQHVRSMLDDDDRGRDSTASRSTLVFKLRLRRRAARWSEKRLCRVAAGGVSVACIDHLAQRPAKSKFGPGVRPREPPRWKSCRLSKPRLAAERLVHNTSART